MKSSSSSAVRPLAFDAAGEGKPLILLHGLSGSRRWWTRNVPPLSRDFRIYRVDLPGFGESRAVHWTRLQDTAERLVAWMADEGLDRVTIAGHSMGGAIAALIAASFPERVDRLVLVDASIRPYGAPFAPRAADIVRAIDPGRGMTGLVTWDFLRSHPGSVAIATADLLRADWGAHLRRIAAPTLVIWGERDIITPLSLGHAITASIPDARLVIVPNAGHTPMWEQPEVFNAELRRFLA